VNRPETHLRTSLPSYTNIPFQDRGPVMLGGCGDHIPSCIL
jgi:hypothetical protein